MPPTSKHSSGQPIDSPFCDKRRFPRAVLLLFFLFQLLICNLKRSTRSIPMNRHHAATRRSLSDTQRQTNAADLRLGGRWLWLARALWLALTMGYLLLFALGIPAYYSQLH